MSKAFTLIELLVVSGIIVLTVIFMFPNYRAGQEDLNLQISVSKLSQNLRKVQEMAVSAKEFQGGVPEGGYGIYFNISAPDRYILFADIDNGRDYDGAGELVETIILEENTAIESLSPPGPLTVIFYPPDPTVYFYPDASTISVNLKSTKLGEEVMTYAYNQETSVSGWQSPNPSCDTSEFNSCTFPECGSTFSAAAGDPTYMYDRCRIGLVEISWRYLKAYTGTIFIPAQETIQANKAGLIFVE